jgi:hypothetical protein
MLATSFRSLYEQLLQVTAYASIEQAGIERGMTVSHAPSLGSLKSVLPPGIVSSTFAGEFTGPAGSLLLDAATNTWFIRNSATLAAPATKAFLGDAGATRLVSSDLSLTEADCGVTILADATGNPISVTLPNPLGRDGLTFTIKNVAGAPSLPEPPQPVTVTAAQGKIDGKQSISLGPAFAAPGPISAIKLVAGRGNWWIVARG